MTKRLFVYGTLAPGREPEPLRPMLARMTLVGPASIAGSLYDLGSYPGAILEGSAPPVFGQVFELPDDDSILQALDDYEGFDPRQSDAGLFRRVSCFARLEAGGEVACDIYVYNGIPPEAQRIADGRWRPVRTD